MFTVGSELYTNSAANIDLLQSLGVDVVRLDMNWAAIAPDASTLHKPAFDASDPNAYPAVSWAKYDPLIRELTARRIRIDLALIGPPPLWAEGRGAPSRTTQPEWKPDAGAYADWVHAVGTRYSGHFTPPGASRPLPRIDFWSVWNEPNIGGNLGPETTHPGSAVEVAPGLYRDLLNAAWSSLHDTGHGHDRILIGELAPAGATFKGAPGLFGAMAPLRFLRALYCVDANYQQLRGTQAAPARLPSDGGRFGRASSRQNPGLFSASGFAVHPYGFTSLPPNVRIRNEPDYAELAAMPTLESTLDRLAACLRLQHEVPDLVDRVRLHHQPAQQPVHHLPPARRAVPQLGRVHDLAGPADQVLRQLPDRRSAGDGRVRDRARDGHRPAQAGV